MDVGANEVEINRDVADANPKVELGAKLADIRHNRSPMSSGPEAQTTRD